MKKLWLLLMLLVSVTQAQSFYRLSPPAPGGVLRLCAVTDGNPCATPQPIFGDQGLTQQIAQPVMLGPDGNYGFWTLPGQYILQISSPFNRIEVLNLAGPAVNTPASGGSAAVAPLALAFGQVQAGTIAQGQPVTITNTGPTTIVVTGINYPPGSPFSSAVNPNPCLTALLAGAACTFNVQYQPATGTSNDAANLTVTTTAPIDPQNSLTVALTGAGTSSTSFPLTLLPMAGTGNGTVTDGGSLNAIYNNGICTGTCSLNYPSGTNVTLTATPNGNSIFNGFNGGGCSPSPCSITVTQAQNISFSFSLALPNLTANIVATGQGGGSIVSDVSGTNGTLNCTTLAGVVTPGGGSGCSGNFVQGTTITLTETPNGASSFVGWSGVNGCGVATTCQFVLNASVTVSANFAPTTVPISLVQTKNNCSVVTTTITCNWGSAQSTGDFIVLGAAWPDATTTVSSLTDTKGNTYTQCPAISPKVGTNLTQVCYYAQNIAAASGGANTTTMTLSSSAGSSVTFANLTNNHNNTAATSFVTASITPNSNAPVLLVTNGRTGGNGPGTISSVTGNSLTWTLVKGVTFGATQGSGKTNRLEMWCGSGGAATTGTITINWSVTINSTAWSVDQTTNAATTCANAIGISAANSVDSAVATPLTVTMGTFNASSSATYGGGDLEAGGQAMSAGTSMTGLGNPTGGNSTQILTESAPGNVSPVTETYASTNERWAIIGAEIKIPNNTRDIRASEYSGILTAGNPIDVSAAAVGTSSTPASGSITTTVGNDLIVGLLASSTGVNTDGAGYTQRIKNTFGDTLADQEGVISGTAANYQPTLTSSGNWVATNIAFKAANGAVSTNFSVTIINGGNGNGGVISNVGSPNLNATLSGGTCSGICSTTVPASTNITLTANPQAGSVFAGWQGGQCGANPVCQILNVVSNQNIIATFALQGAQTYFINNNGGAGGSDSNDGLAATLSGGHGPWLTMAKAMSSSGFQLGPGGAIVNFVASATPYAQANISRGGSTQATRLVLQCTTQWTVGGTNCKMNNTFMVTTANNVDIGAVSKFGFEITGASVGGGG